MITTGTGVPIEILSPQRTQNDRKDVHLDQYSLTFCTQSIATIPRVLADAKHL